MKPSLLKLQKIFKLEAERGYDNHAVVGGLERLMDTWEAEARLDAIPEDLIQYIRARFHDYSHLSEKSRAETLQGMWRRVQRVENPQTEKDKEAEALAVEEEDVDKSPSHNLQSSIHTAAQPEQPLSPSSDQPEREILSPQQPEKQINPPEPKASIPTVEPKALNAPVTVLQGVGPQNSPKSEPFGTEHLARHAL